MAQSISTGDRRPQRVAAIGFLIQFASIFLLFTLAYKMKSDAIYSVARLASIGILIWSVIYLVLKQIKLVEEEVLEAAELQRARQAGMSASIFETEQEGFFLARNRLDWMIRWILPSITVLLSFKLLVGHFTYWGWAFHNAFDKGVFHNANDPTLAMWFVVGIGFVNFLYARYTLALAKLPGWRLLHAGAVAMAAVAFACLGLAIALMTTTTVPWAEPLLGYLVRIFLLVLGLEFAVNFVLDFYRPRAKGELPRPSFDSRLLGLVGEPGGFAKSIADSVNYQFGFEVSSTWFYQLLQRWLFPIMVFTFLVVLALTSVLIVDAGEEVVVEHWGNPTDTANVLGPGLHLKWPYPIDVVYRAPALRVNETVLGEATKEDDQDPRRAVLWTESHEYVPELMVLVASPKSASAADAAQNKPEADRGGVTESVPVSLLMISVPIHYRIRDTHKYLYQYAEPLRLLEAVAYQFLSDYAAGMNIDELMGSGREEINKKLQSLIQKRIDQLDLGIEIVFAGIRGAHPPSKDQVAATFQKVISAQTAMGAVINAAEGEARKILIGAAGSENAADDLDAAIKARDKLRSKKDVVTPEMAAADALVNDYLVGNPSKGIAPVGGRAASMISVAHARAGSAISDAAIKARIFETQVAAYTAAPDLFEQRQLLEVYSSLDLIRKYLIVGDSSNVTVQYITTEQAGLDRVLSTGLEKEQKARGPQ